MRALVQRAIGAQVTVSGVVVGSFEGPGLVALIGVTHDDTVDHATRLANKIYELRIFEPRHAPTWAGEGQRELSAADLSLPLLVISQFTLYADTRKGRRPTWEAAAPRPVAEPLIDALVGALRQRGAHVATGTFGADMLVHLTNDGPMTISLEV